MAKLRLTKIHETQNIDGRDVIVRTNRAITVAVKDSGRIVLQHGEFFGEGGARVDDLPEVFRKEFAKISPKALMAAGLNPERLNKQKKGPAKVVEVAQAAAPTRKKKVGRPKKVQPPVEELEADVMASEAASAAAVEAQIQE